MLMREEDKKLVQKIIQKDEKALLSLYRQYSRSLDNFIYSKIKDRHISEEIMQDVFLDFIEALRDFHQQCSLKTFLFSIAKHKTIDYIRKKRLKKILFSALPPYFIESLKTIFIDDEIEKKELSKKIGKTMELLPKEYSVILRLKYIEGERVINIAEKLALRFKATESLLFRARKAFIKIFRELP